MTSRAFAIRLAIILLVFVVVVPGAVVGLIYAMEKTPGWRDASLGLGYAAFFLGIPIWILSLAIALWRATAARARTLGLPGWIAASFLVLVIAEWKFFLWMFYSFRVPFLAGAGVLLAALMVWPAPASNMGDAPAKASPARLAAIGDAICGLVVFRLMRCDGLGGRRRPPQARQDLAGMWRLGTVCVTPHRIKCNKFSR
jgi:hypothetical protein